MKKMDTGEELRNILSQEMSPSAVIDEKMQEAYRIIRKQASEGVWGADKKKRAIGRRKKKGFQKILIGAAGMAAAVCIVFLAAAADPVMAAKIPLIGWIFKQVEEKVSYPGSFDARAEQLLAEDENAAAGEEIQSPYVKEADGVRFTISEIYCNDMALYLAVCLEAENGFDEAFIADAKGADISKIMFYSTAAVDLSGAGLGEVILDPGLGLETPYYMEGEFKDEKTFAGIIRADLTGLMQTAGADLAVLPEHFGYELTVTDIYADYEKQHYRGEWNFELEVTGEGAATIPVNQVNEDGIGIACLTKTDYELCAELILPEGADKADYLTVICDANGEVLSPQGENAETYSLWKRDVSRVTVYVYDYITYMDECKGADAKALLPQKALFAAEVKLE
ncbi:MAG: DUF4179 domain-containing protein [Eubacteriales bacterium]|nr:DUF4179 domain-containing protein [Eubacteriales bacterium]